MRQGIFRRIFILYTLILFVAGLLGEIYITSAVRENYIDNLKKHLSTEITLLSRSISFSRHNLDPLCGLMEKDTGARVTVITDEGEVIGDSDTDSARMENHLHRPEIQQSLLSDAGSAIRYSNTLNYDFLYVAKHISGVKKTGGFIRMAVPLREVDRAVTLFRLKIGLAFVVILLATGAFALWQTDHLRRLLKQITDFSRALSRGEIDRRLYLGDAGEFNEIAGNLTLMSNRLQETLAKNEEENNRLTVILTSIPDALLIIDAKGMITLSSSSAKEFFSDVPPTGRHFSEIIRCHEFSGLTDTVRKTHVPATAEVTLETPYEKILAVRVSPLFFRERELSGFIAIFHDITQIEKLEQVRKDFVANVSHEIKTPVTAIRGFADTLLEGALDDKENAVRFLETIRSNSERINSLVDDLMTISKIELGVIRVEKAVVDCDDVFGSITDLFRDKAAAKGLSLTVSNPRDIKRIVADKNRLIQIMTNLVDNAVKFTEAGHVDFGVDKEGERIFLFVEDTGIGVPAKHAARLGERFYRVDPARSRKMGGTGLGLAIVKHLVKAHGWGMQIESAPGRGTRISIFL